MSKTLVIAEKPSVAKDIAKVLGCEQSGNNCLYNSQYIITWALGHLVALANPEDYNPELKKWQMQTLPIIPDTIKLKVIEKTKQQYYIVKELLHSSEVSEVICATDAGREGELIFRYIVQYAGCKKPMKRLWISSMTDKAIQDGFQNLRPLSDYDHFYESAWARSLADWLVGINATRAYTVRQGAKLSLGRVQTPTLAMVVDRQKEIESFIPQDYWEVHAYYEEFSGIWHNRYLEETRSYNEFEARQIANKVSGKHGKIISKNEKEKQESPPLLYDLTELQRDANKKFGYSAQDTLDIAQRLYETYKVITYPRTDSRYITDDMTPKLPQLLNRLNYGKYSKYVGELLSKELPINKRIVNDKKVSDHHAIIPTGANANLPENEKKIYDLIVTRLLMVFMPSHVYKVTTLQVRIEDEIFLSKGKNIIENGWKKLFSEPPKEHILPNVNEGEAVFVKDAEIQNKQTTPPSPYTESSLLSAMENAGRFVEDETLKEQLKSGGIGTPSTRASIIERLLQVGYIFREKKNLVPTEKGKLLMQIIPEQLKSPEMTGKWEKSLMEISDGNMDSQRFINSIKKFVEHIVKESTTCQIIPELRDNEQQSNKDKGAVGKCPVCGKGEIYKNKKGYGCSQWKEGCAFFVQSPLAGKNITRAQVEKLIKNGKTDLIKGFVSKKGKKFNAQLAVDKGQVGFKFKK